MEGINLVLQILAVVSLFMSVILVTNTMTAPNYPTNQPDWRNQNIGGTTGSILKIYLCGAHLRPHGLCHLLATGCAGRFWHQQMVLNLFNIDYDLFRFHCAPSPIKPSPPWSFGPGRFVAGVERRSHHRAGGHRQLRRSADFGSNWLDRTVEQVGHRLLASSYAIITWVICSGARGACCSPKWCWWGRVPCFDGDEGLSASIDYTLDTELNPARF
ncbi:MAG: hypothetical protein U0401_19770 [Anaerolineae bacterium]